MRLSGKLSHLKRNLLSLPSLNKVQDPRHLLGNSQIRLSHLGLLQLRKKHLLDFLSRLPATGGKGRGFENYLPPQLQVGGVFGQVWHAWQAFRVKDWMVEVLRTGYLVLFHHLPPVTWEPIELPSYGSGSANAQSPQEVMIEMLGKGVVEVVKSLGPGYYSCLFIVQKNLKDGIWSSVCQHSLNMSLSLPSR